MQSPNYTIEILGKDLLYWFIETAATRMLLEELKRPELLNIDNMYVLGSKMLYDGTGIIVLKDEEPIGALGSLLVPNTFNPTIKTLVEIFWYVLPEHRNSRAGALLFKKFQELGNSLANESTLSLLPSSEVNITSLNKRGFNLEEYSFRKVNNGSS